MSYLDLAFQGKPLPCQIIDAHTHIGPSFSGGSQQKKDRLDLASQLEAMDTMGIDCLVTSQHGFGHSVEAANLAVVEGHSRYPGRIYGYFPVVPHFGVETVRAEFEKYRDHPAFVGFKFLPGYHGQLRQKEYYYALDMADELRCPVLVHLWDDNPPLTQMVEILDRYHNLQLLFAHQGGGMAKQTERCVEIVHKYENAFIEICGSFNNTYCLEDMVGMFGADRIIFGTDGIDLEIKYDFGCVAFSQISDGDKEKIFAKNFLRAMANSQLSRIPAK